MVTGFQSASSREVGKLGFKFILFPLYCMHLFFKPPVWVLRGFCGQEVGEGRTQDLCGARGPRRRDCVEE